MGRPSPVSGFRLAVRLSKLVVAVWLVSMAVFLPAQLVVQLTAAETRANLPAGAMPPGDEELIFVETLRPVAVPFVLAVVSGWVALLAWSILWHGGVVRWRLGAGADQVRLAEILGHGVVWWWRYFRLACVAIGVAAVTLAAVWLPLQIVISGIDEPQTIGILLLVGLAVCGISLAAFGTATLRGGWFLGESDRRSALVAWLRGLGSFFRWPFRSIFTLLVWTVPGLALGVTPLLVDGPLATFVVLLAWLGGAFCWVAIYLSFAAPEPQPIPEPAEQPEPTKPYTTTQFPVMWGDGPDQPASDQ